MGHYCLPLRAIYLLANVKLHGVWPHETFFSFYNLKEGVKLLLWICVFKLCIGHTVSYPESFWNWMALTINKKVQVVPI